MAAAIEGPAKRNPCCVCCVFLLVFVCCVCLQSDLVKVYVGPDAQPHEVSRISSVGSKAHGLVAWGPRDLLMLDSDYGALVSVDVATGHVYDLYVVSFVGRHGVGSVEARPPGPREACRGRGMCLGGGHVWKKQAAALHFQRAQMTGFSWRVCAQTQVGLVKACPETLLPSLPCVPASDVPAQVPEEGKFLKGLAVLDDVAYFGITTWAERRVRDRCAR
jgi:hypothetical protein